jgi:SAM-dependent methyltransferase
VGVDLAEGMVNAANEEAQRRGFGTPVRVMDAERLDFPDVSFDRVLCRFGVMFFPHRDLALAQFRRGLKPGGRLGVSTWQAAPSDDLRAVLVELGLLVESNDRRPPGWITEPDELARVVVDAGFTDLRVVKNSLTVVYADVEQYWHSIRGNMTRRFVDSLDEGQIERARAAVTDRFRAYERPDRIHVVATALLAVGGC